MGNFEKHCHEKNEAGFLPCGFLFDLRSFYTVKYWEEIVHEAQDNDPARASVTGKTRYTVELEDRTLTVEGDLSFTSDGKNFFYRYTRRVLENGKLIREKTWEETIPRHHH